MYLPRGVAQPAELIKDLNALAPFPPGVANLRYTVENDWTGDPAIFFWVTLLDDAARPPILLQTSRNLKDYVVRRIDPVGRWGLLPYFSFRSKSEQDRLKEEVFG
jgi:hypothetical protein